MSQGNKSMLAARGSSSPALSRGPDRAASHEEEAAPHGVELCPICRQAAAREWLRAPDRLHGRKEKYTLLRCSGCSLVWQSDPPRPEEMHLHYTDAYHKLISSGGENSRDRWRGRMTTLALHKQSGALLDVGCSSGGFLGSMKGEPWKLYGIEMSADCAKRAEARTGAQVFVGDIPHAPFAPGSFDVVTCFDVLEHVYDPLQVMTKVCEWLKPGGIFYVQVPNIDSAEGRIFGNYWHGLELPRHLSHFSPASLRNVAKLTGLREVSVVTQRNPAVGTSLRYVWDDVFAAVGIRRTPVAYRGEASIPWRVARKLVRMTVLRFLLAMAPLAGEGEAIHAIFRKEGPSA
jgi:SAM-dependent methyltransferase